MERIDLKTPSMEGTIYVGEDVISTRLPVLTSGQKNFVVTDSNVYALYREFFDTYFVGTEIFVCTAGEEYKTFASLERILTKMAGAGVHRTSRLFAVGGGVVGDIGGLAAALFMRGISCVQIPTTLLAQVDSSVGGKTAVDLAGVKNIVGAFYQPCEVLVDPRFLRTLPDREIQCGIGEIVKYAALDGRIFDALSAQTDWTDRKFLTSLITACIVYKARVVAADEKENGERRCLNVGHTTGHAIELAYGFSHGLGVLYGMRFETRIAIEQGVCEPIYGKALLALIEKGIALFSTEKTEFSNIERDADKARMDKKNTDDGTIRMAVACAKGRWTMLALPFEKYRKALAENR